MLVIDQLNEAVSRGDFTTVNRILKENKVKRAYGYQWDDAKLARQLYVLSRVVEQSHTYDDTFLKKVAIEIYMVGLSLASRPREDGSSQD